MDAPDVRPHPDRSGLLVTTLIAAALLVVALAAGAAAALGMSPWRALLAGMAATLCLSTAAALALGATLGVRRPRPAPEPPRVIQLPEPVSLARRDALELVAATERRLLRAVEIGSPEAELMSCALDLQGARLRLTRVLLTEDGELPQALQDELLVGHRGTSAWIRSPRLS